MISRVISRSILPAQLQRRVTQLLGLAVLCCVGSLQAAPVVVTTIKPLQLIAAAVTEGVSSPALVMDGGHDPHHVSLRPSDRRKLQQAELALWVGPALESPLQDVMTQLQVPVITAQQVPQVRLRETEGSTDPHLWLDTRNARYIASALADTLKQLDPDNSVAYSANLDRFVQMLAETDERIVSMLNQHRQTAWTASHQAFGYFTEQFELQQPLTLTDSSNNAAGVRRVVELRAMIDTQGIECLLTETAENPTSLDALIDGSNLRPVAADVLGNSLASTATAYRDLILALADDLAACLGGHTE